MKLGRGVVTGAAVGLAATGAQAADFRAAPVDYVRICRAFSGDGWFYVPGTQTCLRIGGRVRAEYNYTPSRSGDSDVSGFRSLGRAILDARVMTEYGPVRAFLWLEMARRTGSLRSGTAERAGRAEIATGIDFDGRAQTEVHAPRALVELPGFFAGRNVSAFDFYANDTSWINFTMGSDTTGPGTSVFGYTARFGNGWSATLAVEDSIERRQPLGTFALGAGALAGSFVAIQTFSGTPVGGNSSLFPAQVNNAADLLGVVEVQQAWGAAQLSAALHPLDAAGQTIAVPATATTEAVVAGARTDTEVGFAIQAGAKIMLPMLGAGDLIWLQAAYADGATAYTFQQTHSPTLSLSNRFSNSFADGMILPNGDIRTTKSWSAVASLTHYWTPQLRSNFLAGYGAIDFPAAFAQVVIAPDGSLIATGAFLDTRYFEAGTNLIWSPVRGLDIGVEAMYKLQDPKGRVLDANRTPSVATSPIFTLSHDEIVQARVRVQRDF
jgi:Porin subfamily